MQTYNSPNSNKLSAEFAARLMHLEPQQKVRVIVLLQLDANKLTERRQSRVERQVAIENVRESTAQALSKIGNIIQHFDGQQLAEQPSLLGAIPIEITAAGVDALTQSEAVKAVIEDQAIHG